MSVCLFVCRMRICFELLEMLKAHKKALPRGRQHHGYIAKAIGPHDVLAALLNNLRVQERQMRVCTTVAIAIVSETCGPFTVLPAVMNEYRLPEMNVQNGVLKVRCWPLEFIHASLYVADLMLCVCALYSRSALCSSTLARWPRTTSTP